MWHRVDVVLTDVSEEHIASIFWVEGKIRKSTSEERVRTGASRLLFSLSLRLRILFFFYSEDGGDTFLRNVG
jgi:hypothetical protein